MIIAVIDQLVFRANEYKQSAIAYRIGKELAERDWTKWKNNIRAVLADNTNEAGKMLAKEMAEYLAPAHWEPNPKDFYIKIRWTEVKDGQFWIDPCITNSTQFELSAS